jgi:hypothetical protein
MRSVHTLLPALCLSASVLGCNPTPSTGRGSNDPADLARCLPEGVTMSDPLSREDGTTVGQRLKELGAHVENGKLFDRSGKEIRILTGVIGGAQPPPDVYKRQQEEEQKLREQYTIIDLRQMGP